MSIKPLEINSKKLTLMKPVTGAKYDAKTVLTNSVWEYVDLWLRSKTGNSASEARFFWQQAQSFFNASECLPIESRPLTSYYCCLNAAKALLAINGNNKLGNISHGVSSTWTTDRIKDANVVFQGSGVLNELSKHFNEGCGKEPYTAYDLLYNIPCIHRAFSLTYNVKELFIPVRDIEFIVDSSIQKGWVQFQVDSRYANGKSVQNAPARFERVTYNTDSRYLMRSKRRFDWDIHSGDKKARIKGLSKFHSAIRKDLYYIYGATRLWYLKKDYPNDSRVIRRSSITLIFAVMHWLSELVRYDPEKFQKLMDKKQNWLIHEFVNNTLYQYIDEIACEITQTDIMPSGYRK